MAVKLSWDAKSTSSAVAQALRTLGQEYPIVEGGAADVSVTFRHDPSAIQGRCERQGATATITYAQTHQALRWVGALLGEVVPAGTSQTESTAFTTLGIMLDCSRNAVMTVANFQKWLRRLALLGYNMAMLYTEDTYELPDEPYFGYMRGRYTAAELREIDAYAASLGVEMIPCIQTLGHLEQILRWHSYDSVKDTSSVLMVGEEKTYALIDKMLGFWKSVFRSPRIHIGMDETHDLGRGRYMDRKGYKRGYDIFNEHLSRVIGLCEKHSLSPMIWSDMYFRMGSLSGDYYDKNCKIPADVKDAIPKSASLVYWDYYHDDEAFYADWIARHRELGFEPIMGSGVWTWALMWYNHRKTVDSAVPCVSACRNAGVKELFFTMWGDDGGYADFNSAMAGLAYMAEVSWQGTVDESALAKRFAGVCSADYAATIAIADTLGRGGVEPTILWDDPLMAMSVRSLMQYTERRKNGAAEKDGFGVTPWTLDELVAQYEALPTTVAARKECVAAGDVAYACDLAAALALKLRLVDRLYKAWPAKDRGQLKAVVDAVPTMLAAIAALDASFKRMWLRNNKPFGLETMQIRLAGQSRRWQELAERLTAYLAGSIATIEELDEPQTPGGDWGWTYRFSVSGSVIL
jgi:hypothetical protein